MADIPLYWKLDVKGVEQLGHFVPPGEQLNQDPYVLLMLFGGNDPARRHEGVHESPGIRLSGIQEDLEAQQGKEEIFEVTVVLVHEDMIVAEVVLAPQFPCAVSFPHLVLWRSLDVQPIFAYELLSCPGLATRTDLDVPVRLTGTIALRSQSGGPTRFSGDILAVETHPRAARQAEPKGHATFLSEELADKWKQPLAASIRSNRAGPEAWKLKANVQGAGRPGHVYLRWGAAAAEITAEEISEVLEARLRELMA
eukprot:TRINITY_DN44917_c0_g1_i1.p1 TRINITY_DN44917_c0_g1~~TRINITY_DN44917_c0_g1_i1.p1  ORF type:complete len:254 (+),score=36.89 TRINITY_DN44917_c0_g1_i1:80-841(+)